MTKKLIIWMFAFISILFWYNIASATTIWWSFSSIPVNYNWNDISNDLNLKLGWKVATSTYLLVWQIPSSLSWDTINWLTVSKNCADADVNTSCLQVWKSAIFYTEGDTNWVEIKSILEFYSDNWTRPSNGVNNFKWMHQNQNWTVFFIENWKNWDWTDMKIWATTLDTTNKVVKFVSWTPVYINWQWSWTPIYIDHNVWMSVVDDYLFIHWWQRRNEYGYRARRDYEYPMFSVIDLSWLTPTVVYSSPKYDEGDNWIITSRNYKWLWICFNSSTSPTSLTWINANTISTFNFTNLRSSVDNPYSLQNACINAGKEYLIENPWWEIYVKWVFVQNNKLYVITSLNGIDVDCRRNYWQECYEHLWKVSQSNNWKPQVSSINNHDFWDENQEKTFFEGMFWKDQVMVYDWNTITP